jgi:hypothetical protein
MSESSKSEVLAQELDSIGSKLLALETRLEEVEKAIRGLEAAALSTARALDEVSSHWEQVYRAMRRAERGAHNRGCAPGELRCRNWPCGQDPGRKPALSRRAEARET